jgi:hypothetical protein
MWISLKQISTLFDWNVKQRYVSRSVKCIYNLSWIKDEHLGPHVAYILIRDLSRAA